MALIRVPLALSEELKCLLEGINLSPGLSVIEMLTDFAGAVCNLVEASDVLIFFRSLNDESEGEFNFISRSEKGFELGIHQTMFDEINNHFDIATVSESSLSFKQGRVLVPFSSNIIFLHGEIEQFVGYLCFSFKNVPEVTTKNFQWMTELPKVTAELVYILLLERTLGFKSEIASYAHEIKRQALVAKEVLEIVNKDPASLNQHVSFLCRNFERILERTTLILLAEKEGLGRLFVQPMEVDFEELVREAVDEMMPLIEASGMKLSLYVEPNIGKVLVDPALFPSVVQNLIHNAMKYADGSPDISIHLFSGRDNTVILQVDDQGRGIAPDDFGQLFSRGYRDSSVEKLDGTGLGLFSIRRIVEEHGGLVCIKNREGKGKSFVVTLPRMSVSTLSTVCNPSVIS